MKEWTLSSPSVPDSEDILKQKGFNIQKHGTNLIFSKGNHYYIKSTEFGPSKSMTNWTHYHKGNPVARFDNEDDLKNHIQQHQHESSHILGVLSILSDARYPHRIPKVAASPTDTKLDFISVTGKKKRRAPMDKLVNNNGQWLRT